MTTIFVHGAAADARVWDPVIAALPAATDARAVTLTYFGQAPWPDDGSRFGTDVHAADVIAAAAEAGGKVDLVCWSYSVHVGLAALVDRPDLFASALFYEAGMPVYVEDPDRRARCDASFGAVFGPVGKALAAHGDLASVEALAGENWARLDAEQRGVMRANARTMPLLMGGGQPPRKIALDTIRSIDTPTRVLAGSETQSCFALPSRDLAALMPNATFECIDGADHFLPMTDPARFAGLVSDLL